jgi:phytoene dehydrogenase-like protein
MIPFFLGVRDTVIPVGMKDLLISILDLEKPHHDGNVLFVSLSPKGDGTRAPEGRRALIVESLCHLGEWEQTSFTDFQKRVMGHLNHLFPFLEDHIDFIDFQWAREQAAKWSYPHFVYEATSDFNWREGVIPVRVSKNIYFVGKENFPYLGLEGEILSGLMAAQQISKISSSFPSPHPDP